MKHPGLWKFMPFPLLAAGVFGFARLSDHYGWSGGTKLLIGVLMLALFIVVISPITLLPDLRRRRDAELKAGERLVERLTERVADRLHGISTREGAQYRPPR